MKKGTAIKGMIITIVVFVVILSAFYFSNYTKLGYMITISYHGFTEVSSNVFIDDNELEKKDNILKLIKDADIRVENLFGGVKSTPAIIVSSDEEKLNKMGYNGSPALTSTYVFKGAHSYVVVCSKSEDIDVLAHELTHAELHERVYYGKYSSEEFIPKWFDEGIALQNDYREKYGQSAYDNIVNRTENMRDITLLKGNEFFDSNKDIRVENYILAKHEISSWINKHNLKTLRYLIQEYNYRKFEDLYFNNDLEKEIMHEEETE